MATLRASEAQYPWKRGIVTTVFWIGERPTANNPVPNYKSSWDLRWARITEALTIPILPREETIFRFDSFLDRIRFTSLFPIMT